MQIITQQTVDEHPKLDLIKKVGNKAANLFYISKIVTVPEFCVLSTDFLLQVLKLPENTTAYDELIELWTSKLGYANSTAKIKRIFGSLCFPQYWLEELKGILKKAGITGPYAIRSSSIFEDNHRFSGAGMFMSELNVDDDHLANSILACLGSAFLPSSRTLMLSQSSGDVFVSMAVIVQNMVQAELNGVLFSKHPVTGEQCPYVEYTDAKGMKLTDGNSRYESAQLCVSNLSEPSWKQELLQATQDICKKTEYAVDLEWAYAEGHLYILQMRPVTSLNTLSSWRVKPLHQIEEFSKSQMRGLSAKYDTWRYKKALLYNRCNQLSIRSLAWYLLEVDSACFDDACRKKIDGLFTSPYVHVMTTVDITDCVVKSADLVDKIYEIINMMPDTAIMISLREMRDNHFSAITQSNKNNDSVLLELMPGAMKGLKSGLCKPARFQLLENGITEQELTEFPHYYKYDIENNEMLALQNGVLPEITQEQMSHFYKTTVRLKEMGVHGALEWWGCTDELIVIDISNTNVDIPSSFLERTEISAGNITGRVIEVSDETLKNLEDISYSSAISVDCFDSKLSDLSIIMEINREIINIKSNGENAILKASKPLLAIALFIDKIDGVIFQEASLLCHLSVLLREKGIPAMSVGHHYDAIKNKESVRL